MTATLVGLLSLQAELITDGLASDARALCSLSACCRETRRIISNSRVWKKLCVQHRVFLPGACDVGLSVVTNDTVIAPDAARRLLGREDQFVKAKFKLEHRMKHESKVLTQNFLAYLSHDCTILYVFSYRESLTPVAIKLSGTANVRLSSVHALPNDRLLMQRTTVSHTPEPRLSVLDLRAAFTNPTDEMACQSVALQGLCFTFVHELPAHPLSHMNPVFAVADTKGAGCIVFQVETAPGASPTVKTVAQFTLSPAHASFSISTVAMAQPNQGIYFFVTVRENQSHYAQVIANNGEVIAKFPFPDNGYGNNGKSQMALARDDGTLAVMIPRLEGGSSRSEIFHISLKEPGAEAKCVSTGNEFFLSQQAVPGHGVRRSTVDSPLFLGGISGLGKIQMLDPFVNAVPTETELAATETDFNGRQIPIIKNGPWNAVPMAKVLYMAMPQRWGKRVTGLKMRGRFALVLLDETIALFDWVQGAVMSPDGGTICAWLGDGNALLLSLDANPVIPAASPAKKRTRKK